MQLLSLYQSPRQSKEVDKSFIDNFELNVDSVAGKNPFPVIALDEINTPTKKIMQPR